MERQEVLHKAIQKWGEAPQVDMCIEEMSELTKALLKLRRLDDTDRNGAGGLAARANIREEIADVQIMLDQMRILYGNTAEDETFKLKRLAARLK